MKLTTKIIFGLILILGIFLRTWNFQSLFYFAIDEEKASFIISDIASGSHFPSVGHPSSVGFRLGPLQYYLIAPFFKLFGTSPIVWGYIGIGVSVSSIILIFKLGSAVNKRVGLLSQFLYAVSYLNTLYDRRGWQLTFHSSISLFIILFLYKLKQTKKIRFLYLLTLLLICSTQFEVATFIFVPFVIISFFIFRIPLPKKHVMVNIIIFIISFTPLLFFDLRHSFLNARYLVNYFIPDAQIRIVKNKPLENERLVYLAHNLIPNTFTRLISPGNEKNVALQYANCPQYLVYKQEKINPLIRFLVIGIFIGFCIFIIRLRNKNLEEYLIPKSIFLYFFLLFAATSLYTYLFHGEMAEYYMQSGFAYFFIITSYVLVRILTSRFKIVAILFLAYFLFSNSSSIFQSFNPYGYTDKLNAEKWIISQIGSASFTLSSVQTCWYSGGYRYLFTYLGKEPASSYMDQYLEEYYKPQQKEIPKYKVILLTPELIGNNPDGYEEFKKNTERNSVSFRKFGAIEVYIEKI